MNKTINLPKFLNPIKLENLIRIGKQNDGGYVIREQDIYATDVLVSLGVSFDWSFEKDFLIRNNKIKIKTFDGSTGFKYFKFNIKTRFKAYLKNRDRKSFNNLIKRVRLALNFAVFFKFNLSSKVIHTEKFVGKNSCNFNYFEKNYGYKPEFIDLKEILNKSLKNVFLSIDIEGSEYDLLDELCEYSNNLTALNIEFHNVNQNLKTIEKFISNLNMQLIHTHVNNFGPIVDEMPTVLELSFSNMKNQKNKSQHSLVSQLPTEIDQPNNPSEKDFFVNFLK